MGIISTKSSSKFYTSKGTSTIEDSEGTSFATNSKHMLVSNPSFSNFLHFKICKSLSGSLEMSHFPFQSLGLVGLKIMFLPLYLKE